MRSVARILFALFCLSAWGFAQQTLDISVPGGNLSPYLVISRGLTWGKGGFGGANNNFIFRTYTADESVCVYLTNNNPTNGHSVTITVASTGDPSNVTFIGNGGKWQTISSTFTQPQTIAANSTTGYYYRATGSANVMVGLSGSTTQAGSPDTLNLFIVQTSQGCGNNGNSVTVQGVFQQNTNLPLANQFPVLIGGLQSPGSTSTLSAFAIGNQGGGFIIDGHQGSNFLGGGFVSNLTSITTPDGVISGGLQQNLVVPTIPLCTFGTGAGRGLSGGCVHTDMLQVASDQLNVTSGSIPAWIAPGKLTNPVTGATLLHQFNKINSTVNPAYSRLVLDCSAACELLVTRTTAQGGTCTAITPQNMQLGNGGTAKALDTNDVVENACTTPPTAATNGTILDATLTGAAAQIFDLTGFVNFHSAASGSGIMVQVVTGFTGVATASLEFVEQ